ncbi:MAG TPA: hypothetical protein VM598_13970, partial [Bdellovibrionota bacterium]|nr:hypothetical protein [Bdellovibrionota bacterium]
ARSRAELARGARWRGVRGALLWLGSYAGWVLVLRLLVLTFVTYFVMTSTASRAPRFEDISEAFGSNEITLVGLTAVAFVVLLRLLNPITSTTTDEIFTPQKVEKIFLPGFFHGALVASGLILALLLSGLYRYLGFIVQFEDAHISMPSIVMRVLAIAGWVYCEEFIFRHKLQRHLAALPFALSSDPARSARLAEISAVLITAIAYCGVKLLQFDLGSMHMLTLFLASIALSVRAMKDRDFAGGAGFFAATLIVFHPVLSLPVFGNEFSGIVLVKHQAAMEIVEDQAATARFFGGGAGGPLGSFAFQLLLILDIARGIIQMRKK